MNLPAIRLIKSMKFINMRNLLLLSAACLSLAAFADTAPLQVQKRVDMPKQLSVKAVDASRVSQRAMKTRPAIPEAGNVLNPELRRQPRGVETREGFVLYEDFEGWDDVTPDWLPEGWTIDHRDSPASQRGWKMTKPFWDPDYIDSKCLTYEVFVPTDDDKEEPTVDEWVITPEFPVAQGMELTYETMTSPYYYDWSYMDDSYRLTEFVIINDFKVNVSDDGGKTWTEVFSHADDLIRESKGNFFAMFNYTMRPFTISLDKYAGKNIKVGFQVTGHGFNTTFVDNVTVGMPPTQTSYIRPLSNLFFGLTDTDAYVPASLMIGPVYSPVTYKNTTATKNADFVWTYEAAPDQFETATSKDLEVTYKPNYTSAFTTRNNLYEFPVLEGSSAATSPDEFTYPGFYQAGGRGEYEIHYVDTDEYEVLQLGMTVADPWTEGTATWADIALPYFGYNSNSDRFWSEECFGSDYVEGGKNWKHLEKVADFFYTPDVPIVVEGIRFNAYGKINRNAKFTAEIYLLNSGYVIPDSPQYTATCTGNDITIIDRSSASDFLGLNFKFDKPIVISKETAPYFVVAISGFRDPVNVDYFSPEMSAVSNPNRLGLGWIGSQICWEGEVMPFSWSAVANYTMDEFVSFYIMLDGIFPWLEGEADEVDIYPGKSASVELDSYYDGSQLTFEGLPEGLTATASGRYGKTVVTFSADKTFNTSRAIVTVNAPGVSKPILVTTDPAGIDGIELDHASSPARYYNLQGVEVKNPSGGIFIKVEGSKSEKVRL